MRETRRSAGNPSEWLTPPPGVAVQRRLARLSNEFASPATIAQMAKDTAPRHIDELRRAPVA